MTSTPATQTPAWPRPGPSVRDRHWMDVMSASLTMGEIVTEEHLAAGLVIEPGRSALGRYVADVLAEMTDDSLARSTAAMTMPIRFRVEHGKRSSRVHASGIAADQFLAAVADRYGVEDPQVVPRELPLHFSLDMPLGTLAVRDWGRFCAHFCVELVGHHNPREQ